MSTNTIRTTVSLVDCTKARFGAELRSFLREPAAVGFTMLFPLMMLILFGSIFSGDVRDTGVMYSQVYLASIIGSSLMSVGFVSIATAVTSEREFGVLKRLAGTPMPKAAYFLGKVGLVVVLGLAEIAIMLVAGTLMFGVSLPADVGHWLRFGWVFLLGSAASTLLGLAIGGLIPSSKSAPAILNVPFVALQFISGVFVSEHTLPSSLRTIASFFPLHWICKGMRSAFLPEEFLAVESSGSWQHGPMAIVLAVWCVIGFLLALRTFRWVDRE